MHRDVKPANIYLLPDGTLKIGDFSISRKAEMDKPEAMIPEHEENSGGQKKTGNVTTRHYRAP